MFTDHVIAYLLVVVLLEALVWQIGQLRAFKMPKCNLNHPRTSVFELHSKVPWIYM